MLLFICFLTFFIAIVEERWMWLLCCVKLLYENVDKTKKRDEIRGELAIGEFGKIPDGPEEIWDRST